MPIYEYRCTSCRHLTEVFAKMSDPPPLACEQCGATTLEKVLHPVAVHYKGSGFYSTDYGSKKGSRTDGGEGKEGSGGGDSASSGGDSGGSSGSEAGSSGSGGSSGGESGGGGSSSGGGSSGGSSTGSGGSSSSGSSGGSGSGGSSD